MGGRRFYKGIGYRILKTLFREFVVTSAIVNLLPYCGIYIASRCDEEEGSKRVLGIKY